VADWEARGSAVPDYKFEKIFTPEEANDLLPRIEVLIRELQLAAKSLRNAVVDVTQTDNSNEALSSDELLDRHPRRTEIANQMAELAAQVERFGCFLKDIDRGLVDFPFEIEGKVAFLSWQYGEPQVIAWHLIESGFGGRRPLPGAPKTWLN
jgi:hypothetical protein